MTATRWSAGSTASASAARSSAKACSTARATPRRSRWCIWWRGCSAGGFRLLDTQFVTDHLKTFGAIEVSQRRYHKLLEEALVGEADFAALAARPPGQRRARRCELICAIMLSACAAERRLEPLAAARLRALRGGWRLRRRRAAGCLGAGCGRRFRHRRVLPAFAVGQPDVVDRMLDRVQARARGEHPAGEDALDLALQRQLVDLDEAVGVRRLGRRARVADARRHLERAELHRLVDRDIEGDDAAGDLVEAGEHRGRIGDVLRRRLDHDLVAGLRRGIGRLRRRAARLAHAGRQAGQGLRRAGAAPGCGCSCGGGCGAAARRAAAAAAATGCVPPPGRLDGGRLIGAGSGCAGG